MGIRAGCIGLVAVAAIFTGFSPRGAWAANGAYAVDAADISEVGSCKVETWMQAATNTAIRRKRLRMDGSKRPA